MRYSLPVTSIDKIKLYMANIKVNFHHYLVSYIGQKHFNILKSILLVKKSTVG